MANDVVRADEGGLVVRPTMRPKALIEAHAETLSWVREALRRGEKPGTGDYGQAPGTDGDMLFKPGIEKILLGFNLEAVTEIVDQEADHDRATPYTRRDKRWYKDEDGNDRYTWEESEGITYGVYRYVVRVRLLSRATGLYIGEGLGSASSLEKKWLHAPRDNEANVLNAAVTRATRNALKLNFGLSGMFDTPGTGGNGNGNGNGNGRAAGNGNARPSGHGRVGGWPANLRMMDAKLEGACANDRCGRPIRKGDRIGYGDGRAFCDECATAINHGIDPNDGHEEPEEPPEPPEGGAAPNDDGDPFGPD